MASQLFFFSICSLHQKMAIWRALFAELQQPILSKRTSMCPKCTSPRILIRFVKHMHHVYTRRTMAADVADALFLPQRTQKMRRQR
jgi:hypothetical protein